MQLTDRISSIKGVGEKTEKLFAKLSLFTVSDLLSYYPRTYETYELPTPIEELREGKTVTIEASILKSVDVTRHRNLQVLTCVVTDPTGTLKVTWFNQPYMRNALKLGVRHILRGRVAKRKGTLVMEQPKLYSREEYRKLLTVLQPVYSLTEGLLNGTVTRAVQAALASCEPEPELLPRRISQEYHLIPHKSAISEIHFPKSMDTWKDARRRLVFEEFFFFLLTLSHFMEQKGREQNAFRITDFTAGEQLRSTLPFALTAAQSRVYEEIKTDLSGAGVMARLIQGDVGSGKTILAMLAMLDVVKQGYQAALMAPTEILARQHHAQAVELLGAFGIRVELLTGSMTAAAKRSARDRIKNGEADVIIGTQALFQSKVEYQKLALVITDEQHRFGVRQRESLSEKGEHPHILVMSATPIPRTLAIILYGDLDVSLVDELPAGRLPIKNCVVNTGYRETAYRFIKGQLKEGHQAYIICAMVEDSEHTEAENVLDYTEQVREALGSTVTVEYLHGRMSAEEKTDRMNRFAAGEISVLVSTTVIEVGINVPNATVMMVENAERFGLAQLHQLRGRVGRGSAQSYCIMVSAGDSKETMERLQVLNQSNDGFFIAGEDLRLRGPGDLFGLRQSGDMSFTIADIYTDSDVLAEVNASIHALSEEESERLYLAYLEGRRAKNLRDMAETI